jgi:hypothetical protein
MTKILVTGSREWPPTVDALEVIFESLDDYLEDSWDLPEMIVGMSPEGGVNTFAYAYAVGCGYGVIPVPAEVSEGRTRPLPWQFAKRNQKMVDMAPDVVLAFFVVGAANKGTQMTVDMAEKAGIKVERHYWNGLE